MPVVSDQSVYNPPPFTTTAAGTYRFVAEYVEGEATPAATLCDEPTETVEVTRRMPTLTTQASAPVVVGGSVTDTATLIGAFNPTGIITFSLYPDNADCSGGPVFTSAPPVLANGSVTSGPFAPASPGVYR